MRFIAPLLFLLALGCSGKADAGETLVLTGSSTIAPLAAELGVRFEAEHPGVRVDVQSGGTGRGIADARSGAAHIGMASRALAPDERDLLAHGIASDGIALIVNAANGVTGLTRDQVRRIYLGEVDDWSEVGGTPGPIIVVNKAAGRATLQVFLEHMELEAKAIAADVVVGENEQGVKTVAGTPGAIGYVSIGTARVDIEAGVAIRFVALDGVEPKASELAAGRYALARPLNFVTAGPPEGRVADFIAFAKAPAQHDLIVREHFQPLD